MSALGSQADIPRNLGLRAGRHYLALRITMRTDALAAPSVSGSENESVLIERLIGKPREFISGCITRRWVIALLFAIPNNKRPHLLYLHQPLSFLAAVANVRTLVPFPPVLAFGFNCMA